MKKFILPAIVMAFSFVALVACEEEDVDPCGEWWLEVELEEGAEFIDTDGDGTPDGITFMEGDETITVVCDGSDADGDCIPDCYDEFMDGEIEDGGEDDDAGEEDGEDGEDDGTEEDPCGEWWIGLEWVDGATLTVDAGYAVLTYTEGEETISMVCEDDLDEDCIPDCFEEYLAD